MAVPLTVNGITYSYPELTDEGWGSDATKWAVAVTQNILPKSGGLFALTGDVDFGPNFGLKSFYYKTRSANIASTGNFRLANSDSIAFRNSGNTGDLLFTAGSSDSVPSWGGIDLVNISTAQTLTNKTIVAAIFTGGTFNSPIINTPTVAGGTFSNPVITGQLQLPNGSVSSPSLSFTNQLDAGLFRASGNSISMSVGASQVFNWQPTLVTSNAPFAITGQQELRLNNSANTFYTAIRAGNPGTSYTITLPDSAPATNTFLEFNGTNYIWANLFPLLAPSGTVSNPSYSFSVSPGTGWYLPAANTPALTSNGVEMFRVDSTGAVDLGYDTTSPYNNSVSTQAFNFRGQTFRTVTAATSGVVIAALNRQNSSSTADAFLKAEVQATGGAAFVFLSRNASGYSLVHDTDEDFKVFDGPSGNVGTVRLRMDGSTKAWYIGTPTTSITHHVIGNLEVSGTLTGTGQLIGAGSTNGSNAAAGIIGEYFTSGAQGPTNAPATTQYGDLASIPLTAGDWDVTFPVELIQNGSTLTKAFFGISTHTGNDGTGLVSGDNFFPICFSTSFAQSGNSLTYRINISTPQTVYAKMYSEYSAGTPQFRGRISARRAR